VALSLCNFAARRLHRNSGTGARGLAQEFRAGQRAHQFGTQPRVNAGFSLFHRPLARAHGRSRAQPGARLASAITLGRQRSSGRR
jgi:hypothetical protein